MLLLCAKAHHVFHAGAVVPAAIKGQDFARRWKMPHIPLKIHLTLLSIGWGGERQHAECARAHAFGDGLDGAAFAGPVATFKEDDDAQAIVFHPFLELARFSLKPLEFFFVFLPFQLWLETAIVFFPLGHNYPPHNRARYFVAAIDLRKSVTLYTKNASPIPPTIAKLRHTASSPPPR
jgi:hypothetical protein